MQVVEVLFYPYSENKGLPRSSSASLFLHMQKSRGSHDAAYILQSMSYLGGDTCRSIVGAEYSICMCTVSG